MSLLSYLKTICRLSFTIAHYKDRLDLIVNVERTDSISSLLAFHENINAYENYIHQYLSIELNSQNYPIKIVKTCVPYIIR